MPCSLWRDSVRKVVELHYLNFSKAFDTINHRLVVQKSILLENEVGSWISWRMYPPLSEWEAKVKTTREILWGTYRVRLWTNIIHILWRLPGSTFRISVLYLCGWHEGCGSKQLWGAGRRRGTYMIGMERGCLLTDVKVTHSPVYQKKWQQSAKMGVFSWCGSTE